MPESRSRIGAIWALCGVALVGLLCAAQVWFALNAEKKWEILPNEFGDSFGAMNAVISGLAFIALIITLLMQGRELGFQRQELEHTREELKRSRKAQEAQVQMNLQTSRVASLGAILNHKYNQFTYQPDQRSHINTEMNRWNAELEAEITSIHYSGQPWRAANSMVHQASVELSNAQQGKPPISLAVSLPADLPQDLNDSLSRVEKLLDELHEINSSANGKHFDDSHDPLKPIVRAWLFKAKECLELGIRQAEMESEKHNADAAGSAARARKWALLSIIAAIVSITAAGAYVYMNIH